MDNNYILHQIASKADYISDVARNAAYQGYMEYWFLFQAPRTAEDTRRQLCALHELKTHRAEYNASTGGHISKRHNRLLKQYWAFRAMEG